MTESLLSDLKVLDLSRGMSGALATQLLADYGADVVKAEAPGGDPLRSHLPHHAWNRNKRSIVCDLKSEGGRRRLEALAMNADVLFESYAPPTAQRLGLEPVELSRRFPHLVHVSITGYGREGSRRDEPGYETLVDAWLGMQSEQAGMRPGPHYNVLPVASYGAAFLAVQGALAGLRARRVTGRGRHVGATLLEGAVILNTMFWQWGKNDEPKHIMYPGAGRKMFRRHLSLLGVLPCGDGKYMQMHSGQPGRFQTAMELFGLADRVPPVPPMEERLTLFSEDERVILEAAIARVLKTKPRAEWLRLFRENDISAMEVDPPGEALNDPQVAHEKLAATLNDPQLGPIRIVGPVIQCVEAPPAALRPAPRLGEHDSQLIEQEWARANRAADAPDRQAAELKHPLQGIKVVDFGSYFAGPYASRLLADLGADVIKVEPPGGDTLRPTPLAFRAAQRGKRGIALDLKKEEGRRIARELMQWADVVTHNFRPGVGERLGFAYEEVRKLNPDIVYLHSTGFGTSGPRSKDPCFAPLLAGMCGLLWQAAGKGNSPVQSVSNEDHHNGSLGAIALLMGLHYRDRTGRPVALGSSLLGSTLFVTSEVVMRVDGETLFRFELDRDQTGFDPYDRIYRCRDDRWIVLAAPDERRRRGLSTIKSLVLPEDAPAAGLEAWFGERTSEEAIAALRAADVPAETIRESTRQTYFFDDENIALGRVADQPHSVHGRIRDPGPGIRFSDMAGIVRRSAPTIGQHSREILTELGHSAEDIEKLVETRVIAG